MINMLIKQKKINLKFNYTKYLQILQGMCEVHFFPFWQVFNYKSRNNIQNSQRSQLNLVDM